MTTPAAPAAMMRNSGRAGAALAVIGLFLYLVKDALWPYALTAGILGLIGMGAYMVSVRGRLRENLGLRSTRLGANVAAMTLMLLGVLIIVNFIAARHHWRGDFTRSKTFSLSDETVKVLKDITGDVRLTVFALEGAQGQFRDLLESYAYRSKKISYQFVDPDKSPAMAEQYGIGALWKQGIPGVMVVESGKKEVKITENTEEALTNALIKVTRAGARVVCMLEGHGEKDIADTQSVNGYDLAKKALEDQNLAVKGVLPATMAQVPTDCALVMAAGPKRPLVGKEAEMLSSYLDNGGHALIMLDPNTQAGYDPLLEKWGIDVGNDVIVEPVLRLFAGPSLGLEPVVGTYGDHPVTKEFKQNTIFSLVRSVTPKKPVPQGMTVTTLAFTSGESWAEKDLEGVFVKGTAKFHPGDVKGPISIAAASTGSAKGRKASRLIVVGDSDFVNNKFITALYNRDFFLNCVNWLVEEENLMTIRPKERGGSFLFLTQAQTDFVYYFGIIVLPGVIALYGVNRWRRRRRL